MPGKVLVILGAGASKGVLGPNARVEDPRYEPPVAKEIFTASAATDDHLRFYEGANRLSNVIRARLDKNPNSLESILHDLRDASQPQSARDFLQLPLFFQELFGSISDNFITSQGNYNILVHELLGNDLGPVAFVTLNYDLFLDRALGTAELGGPFTDINKYLRPDWMLIKLHGSVNWTRRIKSIRKLDGGPGTDQEAKRRLLIKIVNDGLVDGLRNHVRVADWDDCFENTAEEGWVAYYPHLALPVDDKAEPLCPDSHLEALHEFVTDCANTLAIGVSGIDPDLFDELGGLPHQENFVLVAGNDKEASEAAERFRRRVHFRGEPTFLGVGFSDFITAGHLRDFITACT